MVLNRLISEPLFHLSGFVLLDVVRLDFPNRHFPEERNKGALECVSLDPLLGEPVVWYYVLVEPSPGEFLERNALPGRGTVYRLSSCQPLKQKQFIGTRALSCVFRASPPISLAVELEVYPP